MLPIGPPKWPFQFYGQESVWHPNHSGPQRRYNVGLMVQTKHFSNARIF